MNKLKVICTEHPDWDDLIGENSPHKFYGIYLHGLLEDRLGFDLYINIRY